MINQPWLDDDKDKDKEDKDAGGMFQKLLKARTIMCAEVVTDKMAQKVTTAALLMQDDDAKKPITVYINSPGGSADSGFAILDILQFITPPVRTVVNGLCASAAVMIQLSAKKEHRYSLPNSRFLLHQPSTAAFGSASDIAITAEEIVKIKKQYNKIVSQETGKPADEVAGDADRDFWLSADEAKKYGLVGAVINNFADLK